MDRKAALALLQQNLKNKNLFKHCLAVEEVMRGLARHFQEDEELWGLTGLLHDIDYEKTASAPHEHARLGGEMLEGLDFPEEIVRAVRSHNPAATGIAPETLMEKSLYAADPVTGLIVAAALIHPEKKLASISAEFVLNRFQEKSFARGANRDQIKSCAALGLSLEEFISISLKAMQNIAADLGL